MMRSNGRFLAENGKRAAGLVKVIADAKTQAILGVHLIGPYSSEMIWGASEDIEAEQVRPLRRSSEPVTSRKWSSRIQVFQSSSKMPATPSNSDNKRRITYVKTDSIRTFRA